MRILIEQRSMLDRMRVTLDSSKVFCSLDKNCIVLLLAGELMVADTASAHRVSLQL